MGSIHNVRFEKIRRLWNWLGFLAFLFWSAAIPFAQVQQTRFTGIALFILLGSWLFQLPFRIKFQPFPKNYLFFLLIWAFLAVLPILDFWRWLHPEESWKIIQLRLPFLILPFLVWQLSPYWPVKWPIYSFLVFCTTLFIGIVISISQGPAYIWNTLHSEQSDSLKLVIQRPFYGLILGAIFLTIPLVFDKMNKVVFGTIAVGIVAFLGLIMTKFPLISLFATLGISALWFVFQHAKTQIQKLSIVLLLGVSIGFGLVRLAHSPMFSDILETGTIRFETVDKAYSNSVNTRLIIWRAAFEILEKDQNWLFGLGTNNTQEELDAIYLRVNEHVYRNHLGTHNLILYLTLQYGFLGGMLPVILFGSILFSIPKSRRLKVLPVLVFIFFCSQTEVIINRELGVHFLTWVSLVLIFKELNEFSRIRQQNFPLPE